MIATNVNCNLRPGDYPVCRITAPDVLEGVIDDISCTLLLRASTRQRDVKFGCQQGYKRLMRDPMERGDLPNKRHTQAWSVPPSSARDPWASPAGCCQAWVWARARVPAHQLAKVDIVVDEGGGKPKRMGSRQSLASSHESCVVHEHTCENRVSKMSSIV